ncbi:MAG: allophanate hydrolase subunit 1 [Candidatus Eremiobacteraeota bacterium]|nr:allophanate hydrolase subunit 1 [Candidatus Eremiobacteraeota bacterium]
MTSFTGRLGESAEHYDIAPLGDAAVLVRLGEGLIEQAVVERVWAACELIRDAVTAGVADVVPAYDTVLVRFDPKVVGMATILACVRGALLGSLSGRQMAPRRFRVGVCFDDESGPDIGDVCEQLQISAQQLVERFCAAHYRVAFLGYTAGFPYMLGLPASLAVSRLGTPRRRVAMGSVAIAAGQCGIYPRATPGGWRLIGRTGGEVFSAGQTPPALFAPGDAVDFFRADSLQVATVTQSA